MHEREREGVIENMSSCHIWPYPGISIPNVPVMRMREARAVKRAKHRARDRSKGDHVFARDQRSSAFLQRLAEQEPAVSFQTGILFIIARPLAQNHLVVLCATWALFFIYIYFFLFYPCREATSTGQRINCPLLRRDRPRFWERVMAVSIDVLNLKSSIVKPEN